MFTLQSYGEMLNLAKQAGYQFRAFDHPSRIDEDLICLLRHDIDTDPGAALQLAEIEASLGLRATYFFMLRSPVYNLFGRANHMLVARIIELGHWVGLHYDGNFKRSKNETLPDAVRREANILAEEFGAQVGAVSFHQPGPEVLEGTVQLPGFCNTYDPGDMRGFHYISDSNKRWRSIDPVEAFTTQVHRKLHLLIHPMWWAVDREGLHTHEVWEQTLLANWNRSQEQITATETAYGSKRTFRIEE